MKTSTWNVRWVCPAILAGIALGVVGCADSTTREDVSDARQELREEQQETAEAMREGQQEVAEAQREGQPYTVNKPVTDAQQEAREDVAEQKQDEREAATELKTEQQRLAATQARDAFVKETEQKLADAEARIDEFKTSASSAEGEAKEQMDRTIDSLEGQHDRTEEALGNLKSATLADWQTHRQHVRVALSELDNMMTNVR